MAMTLYVLHACGHTKQTLMSAGWTDSDIERFHDTAARTRCRACKLTALEDERNSQDRVRRLEALR